LLAVNPTPDRRDFLSALAALGAGATLRPTARAAPDDDRRYWLGVLARVADPVLRSLAEGRLKQRMPVEVSPAGGPERREYAHLEAVGRLLCGIAPWLELGPDASEEGKRRAEYAELARRGLDAATDPRSSDYLNFTRGRQPLVDAAFLASAILRAPRELWERLAPRTRANVVTALRSTRDIQPYVSNWLLFSATIEAALCAMGEPWDRLRVDYAVRQHQQWYVGDGVYGDGPTFHWDYYDSFVIHPLLLDVLQATSRATPEWKGIAEQELTRAHRYAAIQERLVSPEGTYPPIGRSLAYRFGAFHLLALMALRRQLPDGVHPAQVRGALTAVIRRSIEAPGTFDAEGWLTIGFAGHQPSVGEDYISTGSLYMCAAGLLPLGLPPDDEFWTAAPRDWTARRAWGGQDLATDHAI
jgi:hypothetical protein